MVKNYPIDFLDLPEIEAIQLQKLRAHVAFLKQNSPHYQRVFSENGLADFEPKALTDLAKLPLTTKADLAKNNRDFYAVSAREIVEYVTTSGTTGTPIAIALSANDIQRLAENESRSLQIAGITEDDLVQITTTLDQRFMAGMAYYLGLQKIGAASIRIGHGHPQIHADNMAQFAPTAIIAVPSFLYKLGGFLAENGLENNIKTAICIGEPLRNSDFTDSILAENVRKNWSANLRSTYASTEMATAFTECEAQMGGHLLPELAIIEMLDESGNKVEDGQLGEIVVTPLGVSGTPLLRYKTGDLARLHTGKCICGRTTPRLGPIEGRREHMLKVKGTTIFPQQIESILLEAHIGNFVIELQKNELGQDSLTLILDATLTPERIADLREKLRSRLRVSPNYKFVSSPELKQLLFPPGSRKPMKIHDLRHA